MSKRRASLFSLTAAALLSLLLPAHASAQNSDPWWRRDGSDRDYRRDRDRNHRHDDDDDGDGHQPGRISDYDRRVLRDVARRLKNRSHDFQRGIDELLDDSRYDGTRREDHINQDVRNFRDAADRFADHAGDSHDLNRSANEARQLLDTAAHVSRYVSRIHLDSRTSSDWSRIRNDLRTVADIYGFRLGDFDDGSRRRDDDDYYRRDRNRRSNDNGGWHWPNTFPRPN